MISHLFKYNDDEMVIGSDKSNKLESKIMNAVKRKSIRAVSMKKDKYIDYRNLSSAKLWLFDHIPISCKQRLTNTSVKCLRRDLKYRLFEDGEKKYANELDIVRMIRDQRWIFAAVKSLMKKKSHEFNLDVKA